jgi:hypothetical protein
MSAYVQNHSFNFKPVQNLSIIRLNRKAPAIGFQPLLV